jgi:mannose-6-phosphate isomerase-like protein (cupin superfamily)
VQWQGTAESTALAKLRQSPDNAVAMDIFALKQLCAEQARSGRRYLEFLRVPSMSVGLYVLPAGGLDTQQPHTEDEIYHVIQGRGQVQVDGEDRAVEPGTTVFVKARVPHRFHTITEELTLLVFFAPAEGSAE